MTAGQTAIHARREAIEAHQRAQANLPEVFQGWDSLSIDYPRQSAGRITVDDTTYTQTVSGVTQATYSTLGSTIQYVGAVPGNSRPSCSQGRCNHAVPCS